MPSPRRFFAACLALGLLAVSANVANAQAQNTIPVSEAQPFMGAWTIAVDAQGMTFNMDLDVTDEGGNVAAQVSSEMGTTKVTRISKSADKLVLGFSMDAQGQMIPVVITLSPTAAGFDAELDFAGGMFMASGKGTKR